MKLSATSLSASICRDSFFDFLKEFWDVVIEEDPVFNWHIEYICGELQKEAKRVFERQPRMGDTVLNVPPGASKSTIVSQMFPAWVWTWFPSAQFLCVSYAFNLSKRDSLKCRDILESEKYQKYYPNLTLREDANTIGLFMNSQKGYRLSVGVMGTITGFHGHFILVDDPLDPERAYSEKELKMVNRWMRTTLPSRRLHKAVSPIFLVQQRLHEEDPSGDYLQRTTSHVNHICLPGELTEDVKPPELAAYYVDGLLDPVRISRKTLEQMEEELGAYGYAAQVLQRPVPMAGAMFRIDKINIVESETPTVPIVERVRSWDKAATAGGGKFSVGTLIGRDAQKRTWILDVERGQWSSTEREFNIQKTAAKDGPSIPVLIEIEGGSGGKESGENTVANLEGYKVVTFHPTGDKEARAYSFASQVGGGTVFCLKRWWTKGMLDELRLFPFGKFSDHTDSLSAGYNHLSRKKMRVGGMW